MTHPLEFSSQVSAPPSPGAGNPSQLQRHRLARPVVSQSSSSIPSTESENIMLTDQQNPTDVVGNTGPFPSIASAPDPFDPASLRIDPAMDAELGVQKVLVHVPVRKPQRQEFFRVRPGQEYRMTMAVLELKEERETYAVMPAIANALPGEVRRVDLRVCISRMGTVFLWTVPLPPTDGRENAWHKTARAAAELGEANWVRMNPNMGAGCYDIWTAPPGIPDPTWPGTSLGDLLGVAFGSGRLDRHDRPSRHPETRLVPRL